MVSTLISLILACFLGDREILFSAHHRDFPSSASPAPFFANSCCCKGKMVKTSRWELFEDAEVVLERKLRSNPYYPFQVLCSDENGRTIYFYSRRTPYFYFSIMGCIVSALWLVIWVAAAWDRVRERRKFKYTACYLGSVFLYAGILVVCSADVYRQLLLCGGVPQPAQCRLGALQGALLHLHQPHPHHLLPRPQHLPPSPPENNRYGIQATVSPYMLMCVGGRTGFRETKFYLVINGVGFDYPILVSNLTVNRTVSI